MTAIRAMFVNSYADSAAGADAKYMDTFDFAVCYCILHNQSLLSMQVYTFCSHIKCTVHLGWPEYTITLVIYIMQ